jgi:hypothetical protein
MDEHPNFTSVEDSRRSSRDRPTADLHSAGDISDTSILDLPELEQRLSALKAEYASGSPYPHLVFEDFLRPDVIAAAIQEFPPLEVSEWNSYIHVNERKYSNTDPTTWGPTLQNILAVLQSDRFVAFVSELIGVDGLVADPTLEGGGLHQSTTGGFLNVHADFTVHPHQRNLQRRANILVYMNPDWRPEYGGNLELWDKDMNKCVCTVAPIANRALIFTTNSDSFHGHPDPMTCPAGTARRSLALYYYSHETNPAARSTEYRARPDDGLRSVIIWMDKFLLRTYDWAKRHLGLSDQAAQRLLGFTDRIKRKRSPSP